MVVGYIRVSTEKQHLNNQKDEIQRYARHNGLSVDRWVSEIVSGKKNVTGRKLGQLITEMKKNDTLIVSEISRLSRTLTDIMIIMGNSLEKGINIHTVKEQYRFDNSINSKILCFAFGLVAEIERNLISLRTKEALALRKAEGKALGRPKGFSPKIDHLITHRKEVKEFLKRGEKISKICREFGVCRDTFNKFCNKYLDD